MTGVTGAIRLVLRTGELVVLPGAYRATLGGTDLELSPAQFELLVYLVKHSERVVSRDELAQAARLVHTRSVDVALSSLRRSLGDEAIRNVRNRGWILQTRNES